MNGPALLAIVGSYLLGSIPAAYIAGKAKGVDLRKHGSGNLGATNVMRVLGTKIGLAVFLFDMAKGAAPVYFFPKWLMASGDLSIDPVIFGILCGIAAIIGHVRPIYLKFWQGREGRCHGGRGFPRARAAANIDCAAHLRGGVVGEWIRVARVAHERDRAADFARRNGRHSLAAVSDQHRGGAVRLLDPSRKHRATPCRRGASLRQESAGSPMTQLPGNN